MRTIYNDINNLISFAEKNCQIETLPTDKVPSFFDWLDVDYKNDNMEVELPKGSHKIYKWKDMKAGLRKKYVDAQIKQCLGTDLKYPVILVKERDGTLSALDGNHRIMKAKIEGHPTIKAYVMPKNNL